MQKFVATVSVIKIGFFAACNGGYITDENGFIIYEARCNDVSLPELVVDLFRWGSELVHVYAEQYICVVAKYEDCPTGISKDNICQLKKCPMVDYFNQVSVQLPSIEESSTVTEKIKNKYAKWLNPLQNGRCIDVVPVGVNKAQGMYHVMEFFGCTYEDVLTVGDNINDIDMICEFRSYAMENGVEEVKCLAYGIVTDITELLEKKL